MQQSLVREFLGKESYINAQVTLNIGIVMGILFFALVAMVFFDNVGFYKTVHYVSLSVIAVAVMGFIYTGMTGCKRYKKYISKKR